MAYTRTEELLEKDKKFYLQTYKRYPIVLESGKGSRVTDIEGREYIDALAGIAVNSVGHCHPKVVDAIKEQAEKLMHISNFYLSEPQAILSEQLATLSGLDRVFFANSGAEAVEGAIKIARKHSHASGRGGDIISMENSFHGRTLATIATGKKQYQEGFDPIPGGFIQVPFNDVNVIRENITDRTAAVILEPVQGEGGINCADRNYLYETRELCDEKGILLIFDEVQCGIARTGEWFAKDNFDVQPDIMTLAKGLGGGVPIGAVLAREEVASAMNFGDHGTTFGGNPLVCAAAIANLDVIRAEDLLTAAIRKGKYLKKAIYDLGHPLIKKVKGLGLMLGVDLSIEAGEVVREMMTRGVLANATAGNILRLVPPLVISYSDLDKVVEVMEESLNVVQYG